MMKLKEMKTIFEEDGYKFDSYCSVTREYWFRIPKYLEPGTVIDGPYVHYPLHILRIKAQRKLENKVTHLQTAP